MTRKHFEAIAAALNEALAESERLSANDGNPTYVAGMQYGIMTAASLLGNAFGDFNPNFDKDRFMKAVTA